MILLLFYTGKLYGLTGMQMLMKHTHTEASEGHRYDKTHFLLQILGLLELYDTVQLILIFVT